MIPLLLLACGLAPEGLRLTPDGDGPMVRVDWDAEDGEREQPQTARSRSLQSFVQLRQRFSRMMSWKPQKPSWALRRVWSRVRLSCSD